MQGLPYCCIYFENLRIKSTVFPNFRSYLCHALRGQFLKRKSKKYVFSVWITCPSCISYETAMLNVFCRKNGNKLMHYANNTNEIPFLTHSDALCGGFRKLRLQENYIWKQPESCDASTSLAESSYQRRSAAQWEYAKATRRWQHWHPLLDSCMLWWIYPRELDWIEENYIGKPRNRMPVFGGCALCRYAKYLSRKSYFSRIMVSKQNTTVEKPKATMVESVEIVPIR